MAFNTLKSNHLTPLHIKGLITVLLTLVSHAVPTVNSYQVNLYSNHCINELYSPL